MSEHDFEAQVSSLYRASQPLPDEAAFLAQVEASIERHVRLRRWTLAVLGLLGGSVSIGALTKLGAAKWLQSFVASSFEVFAGAGGIAWGGASACVLVALLALPAFTRFVIDPK